MPAWEDTRIFFDPADFGVVATITPAVGAAYQVNGIFDDPYLNTQLGEYQVDTSQPRFTAAEPHLAAVKRGDVLTIGGKQFDVLTNAQPDGTGLAIVQMAAV